MKGIYNTLLNTICCLYSFCQCIKFVLIVVSFMSVKIMDFLSGLCRPIYYLFKFSLQYGIITVE